MNVITNPPAQLGIWFLADEKLIGFIGAEHAMVCLVEISVVTLETVLLLWIFRRMHRRRVLDGLPTAGRTFVIALAANVGSFVFATGLLLLAATVLR
jgi:hypothetical protein